MKKKILKIVLLLFIHQTSLWGQTIEQFTSGSFFSYVQDRITFYGNPMILLGENAEMDNLYLENGTQRGDSFFYKFADYKTGQALLYTFIIKQFERDSVLVIPISQAAKNFYSQRKQVKFYDRKYFYDNSISFEKLFYFSGQDGSHYADGIALEVDSNKNVKLKFTSAFNNAESGNYKGKLTEEGYSQLIKFLKTDNIRTLKWPNSEYHGQDPQKLVLYFNKQRKVLIAKGDIPYLTANLTLFFNQVRKFSVLNKTDENLVFDDE